MNKKYRVRLLIKAEYFEPAKTDQEEIERDYMQNKIDAICDRISYWLESRVDDIFIETIFKLVSR